MRRKVILRTRFHRVHLEQSRRFRKHVEVAITQDGGRGSNNSIHSLAGTRLTISGRGGVGFLENQLCQQVMLVSLYFLVCKELCGVCYIHVCLRWWLCTVIGVQYCAISYFIHFSVTNLTNIGNCGIKWYSQRKNNTRLLII